MAQTFQGCSCLLPVFHLESGAHNGCTACTVLDISAMATGSDGGRVKRALLSVTSKLVYFVRRVCFFSFGSGRLGSKHVGEYIGAQCYNNSLHSTVHTVSVCMNVRASHFIMQTAPACTASERGVISHRIHLCLIDF